MKKLSFKCSLLLLFVLFAALSAQLSVRDYIDTGIRLHDAGKYQQAVDAYKKALEIDPKSTDVNYEISFSYFKLGEYKKSIKHADIVIKQNKDHLAAAYINKGSSLDNMGKVKSAIKVYEEGIRKTSNQQMLYYNLAITHYKAKNYEDSEKAVIQSIKRNPSHPSGHALLSNLQSLKGNDVKTIMASSYYLLLAPQSPVAPVSLNLIKELVEGKIIKDENTFTIQANGSDDEFDAVLLSMSLLKAFSSLDTTRLSMTEKEKFIQQTTTLFEIIGNLDRENKKGIWWELYAPFFGDLAETDFMETFCNYISISVDEEAKKWLKENEEKLKLFGKWADNR